MTPSSQARDIRLYMFLRLLMLFSVLIPTVVYQRSGFFDPNVTVKTYILTCFTFFVTAAFIFLAEKTENVRHFLSSQIAYDILFTTVLIFYTGPFDSIYTVFYLFNIIFAAILFRGRGALMAALTSGALYVTVTWFNADGISTEKFFSMLTTLTAFVAIALLSGQFIEEIGKSRQRISRLEQLNVEIVDKLDSGLLVIDSAGIVQRVNRTGQLILGIDTLAALIGRPLTAILPDLENLGGSQMREVRVQGQERRMLMTTIDLPERHQMVLIRDLTDVLALEEKMRRQERLAGIGRLAAGVAHEIRNPIASISGAAQLLGAGDSDEKERLIEIIVRESERVDRLVAQLLRFAKPSAVERTSVSLNEIVTECVDAIKARSDFQDVGAQVSVKLEDGLVVNGSQDQLREVVTNLLVNALQALDEVRPKKSAKSVAVEARKAGGQVELIVTDNGPGIPKEFQRRIFDPFFTTKPNGTGLGLAQVHKIVREHDGQVDVETEEGKGTAMKVRLPTGA